MNNRQIKSLLFIRRILKVEKLLVSTFFIGSYKEYTFSPGKKSYPRANFKKLKISSLMLASYFFSPKKVGKKGFG